MVDALKGDIKLNDDCNFDKNIKFSINYDLKQIANYFNVLFIQITKFCLTVCSHLHN